MNPDSSGRERRSRVIERGDSSLRAVYNDPLSDPRDHFETAPPAGMHLDCSASRVVSALALVLATICMSCQDVTHPYRACMQCACPAATLIDLTGQFI